MFIKKTKNKKSGKIFCSVVEGYRIDGKVRQRTLKPLGYLHELEAAHPDIDAFFKEEIEKLKGPQEDPVENLQINMNQTAVDSCEAEKKEKELKNRFLAQAYALIHKREKEREEKWEEKNKDKEESQRSPFYPMTQSDIDKEAACRAKRAYEEIVDTPQDPWYYLDIFNIGYGFPKYIYTDLGLPKYLNKLQKKIRPNAPKGKFNHILQLLVFLRLIDPCSKKRTWEHRKFLFEKYKDYELHDIYRFLDVLAQHKDEVLKLLWENSNKIIKRDLSLLLYDGTNFYYDISSEDQEVVDQITGEVIKTALRKRGISKEERHDPIVNMGLLTDRDGIPIYYIIYPGNESEKVYFIPLKRQVKKLLGLEPRMIYVADCGLNTSDNKFFTAGFNEEGNNTFDGYIFGKSLKQIDPELKKWALADDNWDVVSKDGRFKYKEKIWKEKISIKKDGKRNQKIEIAQKVVVWFSQKYYDRCMAQIAAKRAEAEYLRDHKGAARAKTGQRFLENDAKEYRVKEKDLQELEALAGLYAIQTSELEMSAIDLMRAYHHRSRIEDDFRVLKSLLEIRPIFVHLQDHVEGHMLTCVIALYIIRVMMKMIGCSSSLEKVLNALHDCRVTHIDKNLYVSCNYGTTINRLADFFHVNMNRRFFTREQIRRFLRY